MQNPVLTKKNSFKSCMRLSMMRWWRVIQCCWQPLAGLHWHQRTATALKRINVSNNNSSVHHLKPKLTFDAVQIILSNTRMNSYTVNIQISHSSATTYLRWDGRICSIIFCSLPQNAKVKELLKPVYICQSCHKNKSGTVFMAQSQWTEYKCKCLQCNL